MPLKNRLLPGAIFFYTAVLFFPAQQALNFIATVILILAFLFNSSFAEKKQLFQQRSYIPLMLFFFLWILISVWLSEDKGRAFRYLDPRLSLLYFPLSIGLVRIDKTVRTQALLGIATITTLISLICVSYAIYSALTLQDSSLLYNDALSEPVTGIQSIYVSMLVNIAIYIFGWFLFFQPSRYKPLMVLAVVILFATSFLLASRNLMIILYLTALGFAFYYILKRKKYVQGGALLAGLVVAAVAVVSFFPKTINRFKELAYTNFDYQQTGPESHFNRPLDSSQWNGANTRLAIWQCGWELFKQEPWLGVHLGDKKARLMDTYQQKGFSFAIRTEKNLHNNYLDILVSLGIIGFILFLIAWIILPLQIAWHHGDGLAILIIATFALAMITENYFDRSLGGTLFGFFVPFLLSDKTKS